MKTLAYMLGLMLIFGLTACGGDESTGTDQSPEARIMSEQAGGPFSVDEFDKFLVNLASIKGLTVQGASNDLVDGTALSANIVNQIKELGWSEDRFMYIYSHAITVANVDQMETMTAQMTAQLDGMPTAQREMMEQALAEQMGGQLNAIKAEMNAQVPASEQDIIRGNMEELYKALGLR